MCACAFLLPNQVRADEDIETVSDPAQIKTVIDRIQSQNPTLTSKWTGKKVILARVTRYKDTDSGMVVIETLHYRYDDGKTIRSRVQEANAQLVDSVEVMEAYPTPLTVQEQNLALELAQKLDAKVKQLVEQRGRAGLRLSYLSPVISKKTHPLFGKRLVVVQVEPIADVRAGVKVTVNLTDESLVKY